MCTLGQVSCSSGWAEYLGGLGKVWIQSRHPSGPQSQAVLPLCLQNLAPSCTFLFQSFKSHLGCLWLGGLQTSSPVHQTTLRHFQQLPKTHNFMAEREGRASFPLTPRQPVTSLGCPQGAHSPYSGHGDLWLIFMTVHDLVCPFSCLWVPSITSVKVRLPRSRVLRGRAGL